MGKKRINWKIPVIAALALLLTLEIVDTCRMAYGGDGRALPVLMYHHLDDTSKDGTVVTPGRIREQMTALREAGYEAVTVPQVIAFVREGTPLPDKPVLITMDDGYTSNLDIAAPILEDLGLCAAVFVIGINEGEAVSAHTGEALTPPRFSFEEAAPWVEKGVLDLQSHTYDMHQRPQTGGVSGREGVLKKEGESAEDYRDALLEDFAQYCRRREGRVSTPLTALSYPFGLCSGETDRVLEEAGAVLTVTVREHCNTVFAGRPGTLRRLGRFNVDEDITGEALVRKLERWGPSVMLQDRLDKALEYLEDHPDITVVVSGGQGPEEPTSEAQGMADYLAARGVARESIILEPQSHNTWQNLTYSAKCLEEAGIDIRDGVIIVSNGFHLSRAKMLAGRIGYENVSVLAAPSSHTPTRLKMYVREPLALVKSFVFDR